MYIPETRESSTGNPGFFFNFNPVTSLKPPIRVPPRLDKSFRIPNTTFLAADDKVGRGIPAGSDDCLESAVFVARTTFPFFSDIT